MALPVTAKIKLEGKYAEKLRVEAASRQLKLAPLVAEYAMRGMDAEENDDSELEGFERRIGATVLTCRSDLEDVMGLSNEIQAMLDAFVLLMLVHLPEPGTEKEATLASAMARWERFYQQVAMAFDDKRPLAMKKIAEGLQKRIGAAEETL